jgi:hypothetical protein
MSFTEGIHARKDFDCCNADLAVMNLQNTERKGKPETDPLSLLLT